MGEKQSLELHSLMESIAFGLTDGVICFLGIIVGVATATMDSSLVLISGIVGGVADAFGNSIGFFVSQSTERAVQIRSSKNGLETHIHSRREVTMSGVFSFIATLCALVCLLLPFAFLDVWRATVSSFIIGIVLSFFLGMSIGKIGGTCQWISGVKYACITVFGALVSYCVGIVMHIVV